MLKDLLIENLILIQSCQLELHSHLNIITGETGSGKTAILHALKLLLGQKLDTSLIRRGESKGFVQARFELSMPQELTTLLCESGVELEDSLILAREISIEGKSKNWINGRQVPLSLLQKVGFFLVEVVDQHSYHELRSLDNQRLILDLFGSLTEKAKLFKEQFLSFKELERRSEELAELEKLKEREFSFTLSQLEELNTISLNEEEENLLFEEYSLCLKAEEISNSVDSIFEILTQSPQAVLSKLAAAKQKSEGLSDTHPLFTESAALLKEASVSIEESLHLLRKSLSLFDPDPQKTERLNKKLEALDLIKRKYGSSLQERLDYKGKLEEKIAVFSTIEEKREGLIQEKTELSQKLSKLASELSQGRRESAKRLEKKLTETIQHLNMKKASLQIKVEEQNRTLNGEDEVSFWLTANQGEGSTLLKEGSSGGELSRILFAIKLCLAEKNNTPTLIFDEIDAGVGGETARLIGESIKKLSSHRQILCITHFPQVACEAHLHLQVQKMLQGERTFASIQVLDKKARELELLRMLGGEKTLSFYANP